MFYQLSNPACRDSTTDKVQLLNNLMGLLNYFNLVGKSYLFLSEVEGILGGGVLTSRAPVCGSCPLQVEYPSS